VDQHRAHRPRHHLRDHRVRRERRLDQLIVATVATEAVPDAGPARSLSAAVRRARAPLTSAAVALVATAAVAWHSPYAPGSYGFCPLHLLTGLWCPACGALRATHDLAHGDVASAWGMNPLWVVLAPTLVGGWCVWLVRRALGRPAPTVPVWTRWSLLGVALAFGVLRNVPALAPWLAP
jgi:hypothetical protein